MQTIFAQATARGKSGVAIVRISGPDASGIGRKLFGSLPEPGQAALRSVRDGSGSLLDQALVLFFKGPRSFTGEDVLELQLHGSSAIVRSVEAEIMRLSLARPAEAGEFTQRALMNNRIDLAQVEGLGDLIEAETEAQRVQAMRVFSGAMAEKTDEWREKLVRALGLLEVTIDFVDEEVPVDVMPEVGGLVGDVLDDLTAEIEGSRVAERVRDGFEVAILGSPNSGKSTLLNTLAGRDVAITSDIAGTTRDVLEVRLDLDGMPVTFLDTAGVRVTDDTIEKLGVERAVSRAKDADIRLLLLTEDWVAPKELRDVIDLEYEAKGDLSGRGVSGLTGLGVEELLADVSEILSAKMAHVRTAISSRQRSAIQRAKSALLEAQQVFDSGMEAELAAEHLRSASLALDSLIGRVDVEHVLDEVFSRFCIGK